MRMSYEELNGEGMDFQGLDWEDIGVSRKYARERRKLTYKNYTNKLDSDKWKIRPFDGAIPSSENFYRFRRMDLRRNIHLAHFQLRNVLACADRSHVFYPGRDVIHRINPLSGHSDVAMDLSDLHHVQVSTLDAKHGMLVVGTFNGEYCMRSVHSQDTRFTEGQVTNNSSCITNHLQIHESRHSTSPLVAFASNDQGFRVMDIASQKVILDTKFKFPMNCTALSPDGRLRVMVGDSNSVIIACAESGGPVQWLSGHRDHGFACAWSEDGWTVATAAQDKSVKIWDAQLASVRGLRFSPVGNGPPVLVAAEEADFVNIINARTFRHKQTIDVFGEIGGVGFTDDGNELNILCSFQPNIMDDIWRQPYRSALHDEEGLDEGLARGGPAGPRTRLYWDDMEPF
ncbi:putative WD repeat-containing protein C2A9.03 like [Verticillium longisporum]|uniref:Putative WD repeat-containing protein C2A9.03 like n=1 Tax=Verticillium longisporum TaxID=100787 RepID=A0A8I2ZLW9_VERLO|nr:putative WD repeat-containing protein C2A9.03 like [Verticillium longisporum]